MRTVNGVSQGAMLRALVVGLWELNICFQMLNPSIFLPRSCVDNLLVMFILDYGCRVWAVTRRGRSVQKVAVTTEDLRPGSPETHEQINTESNNTELARKQPFESKINNN